MMLPYCGYTYPKVLRKVLWYLKGLINGELDLWGGKTDIYGPIVDQMLHTDYDYSLCQKQDKNGKRKKRNKV